jgi:transposase
VHHRGQEGPHRVRLPAGGARDGGDGWRRSVRGAVLAPTPASNSLAHWAECRTLLVSPAIGQDSGACADMAVRSNSINAIFYVLRTGIPWRDLPGPRSPLVVTADKAYDSQTARQQIKDEGALPIIPNRRNPIKQAYCPKR